MVKRKAPKLSEPDFEEQDEKVLQQQDTKMNPKDAKSTLQQFTPLSLPVLPSTLQKENMVPEQPKSTETGSQPLTYDQLSQKLEQTLSALSTLSTQHQLLQSTNTSLETQILNSKITFDKFKESSERRYIESQKLVEMLKGEVELLTLKLENAPVEGLTKQQCVDLESAVDISRKEVEERDSRLKILEDALKAVSEKSKSLEDRIQDLGTVIIQKEGIIKEKEQMLLEKEEEKILMLNQNTVLSTQISVLETQLSAKDLLIQTSIKLLTVDDKEWISKVDQEVEFASTLERVVDLYESLCGLTLKGVSMTSRSPLGQTIELSYFVYHCKLRSKSRSKGNPRSNR